VVKYGVISTAALNDDLVNGRHMYVAGRLQKPVQDIKPPTTSTLVNNIKQNRLAALRTVLLQLPQYTTKYELYYGITALSYMGDFSFK
jgi:translocator assembly and maintenance protein 41